MLAQEQQAYATDDPHRNDGQHGPGEQPVELAHLAVEETTRKDVKERPVKILRTHLNDERGCCDGRVDAECGVARNGEEVLLGNREDGACGNGGNHRRQRGPQQVQGPLCADADADLGEAGRVPQVKEEKDADHPDDHCDDCHVQVTDENEDSNK